MKVAVFFLIAIIIVGCGVWLTGPKGNQEVKPSVSVSASLTPAEAKCEAMSLRILKGQSYDKNDCNGLSIIEQVKLADMALKQIGQ